MTIPKLGTEFDRDVGNRITEHLNREYDDKKLYGSSTPTVRRALRTASPNIGGKMVAIPR